MRTILDRSPESRVLVAHDDRQAPAPHLADHRARVWIHGQKTDWGSWALVAVTLEGIRRLREWIDPDVTILASGQDYVCGDLNAWHRRFVAGGGGWVGSAYPLDYAPRWGRTRGVGDDNWTRYQYRWFDVPSLSSRLPPAARPLARRVRDAIFLRAEPLIAHRVMARAGRRLIGVRRVHPLDGRTIYKGQQMLALDRPLSDVVLSETEGQTGLVRHYKRSVIPDESLIQTLLSWQTPPRSDMELTFIGWDEASDGCRYLDSADLPALLASPAILCRKVSSSTGQELCDALDREFDAG
ncbi:beta-1,6-N-acetylglucosaminyltransferase [Ornithinimicrobium flavum]|uniref:beta-1,6-N-acetylglucosaminyltransferase n=1 Tax=Ornithinimicrobium flavum TaxID=1288636 RepID=UPI0013051CF2|nr:beta-1,6-N-acetylglucosaminyltransferase [Ornithinimicrobium flavum]